MKASIRIEYFEMLDHWSWEVAVNASDVYASSVYGVEDDHDNAFRAAEFALEDLLRELGIGVG